ncbi:hydroxypyruvate isomerase [Massilia sp. Root335]|uniref:hydroxypyruvate isomerase n=1 Tax=Massilia sp. Root335 TaxID=1736517 RepID=UPI0006FC6381|nr:hydroxypyruvate isomerase [Massilia sp. Root335]KQV49641.1 hydroxypyruvate isomerase [Massilia sp. Root335]
MPRFAANLTMLFNELPFLDRFEAAHDAGFKGVEYLFPYGFEKEALAERLQQFGLTQVLHNLPAGDWDKGERGIAVLPGREAEFREGVARAIEYAKALNCRQVNCLVGIAPAGVDAGTLRRTVIENLRYAATQLKQAGIRLLIEPINTYDIPGFYLNTTQQALDLIESVGADNLFVQYDVYHAQRTEGELAKTVERHLAKIAHIQVADNPGRNEPGTGEINYPWLFKHLDRIGYDGWIGCEYKPAADTRAGLDWIARLAAQ